MPSDLTAGAAAKRCIRVDQHPLVYNPFPVNQRDKAGEGIPRVDGNVDDSIVSLVEDPVFA
jgi:hypothetical protein